MSTAPLSLRNIPPDVLNLAQDLSAQTGLSINDVFRLALASGLLIELTKVTPRPDGTFCGLPGALLARALRPHLGSAIDLMFEQRQHPYQAFMSDEKRAQAFRASEYPTATQAMPEKDQLFESSIEEDLDMLGIGIGLSETRENNE
jgi:hypothetical protein